MFRRKRSSFLKKKIEEASTSIASHNVHLLTLEFLREAGENLYTNHNHNHNHKPRLQMEPRLQMGLKPKNRPSFFKFLLHPDFANYLPIPPRFVTKYLEGGKTKNNFMLVTNESLNPWPVTLVDIGGRYCFKLGWPEFVEDNDLEKGDFLLFWLNGDDSTFFVAIYGPSGIEKKKKASSGKSKKAEVKEERDCMHRASMFVKPLHNLFFKVIIERNSTYRLYIPMWFVRETKVLASAKSVTLRNVAGKEWSVKIGRRKNTYGYHLTSGWISFRNTNKIKKGDTCLFQFLQPEGNIFQVVVLNKNGNRRRKEGHSRTEEAKEEGDGGHGIIEAASSVQQLQHTLFFKATLGRSCNYHMGLPVWFARASGLASRRYVILKDERGCVYPVRIYPRNNYGYELVSGWSILRKANNIEKGDTCLFQFFLNQRDVLHVKVIQKKVKRARRMAMGKKKTNNTNS